MNPISPALHEHVIPTVVLGESAPLNNQAGPVTLPLPPPLTHHDESVVPTLVAEPPLELHPSLLAQDASAQYEMNRYIVHSFLKKAGWDCPGCYRYTLRQKLFYEFHLIIKELKTQTDENFALASSVVLLERTLVVELGILCQFFAYAKPGMAVSLESRALQAIEALRPIYESQFPWLAFLRILFSKKDFFHLPIALICQQPAVHHTSQKIFRRLIITYQWLVTMSLPLEDIRCRETKIDECYDVCMGTLRLSKRRETQLRTVIDSWDAYRAGRSLANEMEYRYRLAIDSAIEDIEERVSASTLLAVYERIQKAIVLFEEPSRGNYSRELQLIDTFIAALPTDDEFLEKYKKNVSQVEQICDFDRLNHCRKQLQEMRNCIFFSQSVEKFAFHAFKEDLQTVRFLPKVEVPLDSFEHADESELLEIALRGSSQKDERSPSSSPIYRGKRPRLRLSVGPFPRATIEGEPPVSILKAKASSPLPLSSTLMRFLQTTVRDRPALLIPRVCTHFAALHRGLLVKSLGHLSPRPESKSSEECCQSAIEYRMRGLFNHLYLGSCGFELISELLRENRSDLLSAVFPMWMTDRYLMAELYGDACALIQVQEVPDCHSLLNIKPFLELGKSMSPELHEYIAHLSKGLLWYRYSVSYRNDSKALRSREFHWLTECQRLSREGRVMDPDMRRDFMNYSTERQKEAFSLLYHTLSVSREDESMAALGEVLGTQLEVWKKAMSDDPSVAPRERVGILMEEKEVMCQLGERAKSCLLTMSQRSEKVETSKIVEEILIHLIGMRDTIEIASLFSERHLFGFFFRNLLNVQWLVEHAYRLECHLLDCPVENSHNYRVYEAVLTSHQACRISPSLLEFAEYNCGIGLHYEELYKRPVPVFDSYRQILENNSIEATSDVSFTPIGLKSLDAQALFIEHARKLSRMLERALIPLFDRC